MGWHLRALAIPQLWTRHATRGAGVTVALLDSGVDDVPALEHVERLSAAGEREPAAGHDRSPTGHGTQTASILTAGPTGEGERHVARGVLGIAPECRCLAYAVCDSRGRPVSRLVAQALEHAAESGVELICCPFTLAAVGDELAAALARVREQTIPVIVAAGNHRATVPAFPQAEHEVISVGAALRDGVVVRRFRWEPWTTVSAPGVGLATWTASGRASRRFRGTSAAAAVVAGAATLGLALAKADDPEGRRAAAFRRHLAALLRGTARQPRRSRSLDVRRLLTVVARGELELVKGLAAGREASREADGQAAGEPHG